MRTMLTCMSLCDCSSSSSCAHAVPSWPWSTSTRPSLPWLTHSARTCRTPPDGAITELLSHSWSRLHTRSHKCFSLSLWWENAIFRELVSNKILISICITRDGVCAVVCLYPTLLDHGLTSCVYMTPKFAQNLNRAIKTSDGNSSTKKNSQIWLKAKSRELFFFYVSSLTRQQKWRKVSHDQFTGCGKWSVVFFDFLLEVIKAKNITTTPYSQQY